MHFSLSLYLMRINIIEEQHKIFFYGAQQFSRYVANHISFGAKKKKITIKICNITENSIRNIAPNPKL